LCGVVSSSPPPPPPLNLHLSSFPLPTTNTTQSRVNTLNPKLLTFQISYFIHF
jgi:hypothetical protein